MFNYDETLKALSRINTQLGATVDGVAKREQLEKEIAEAHVSGKSTDDAVKALKASIVETYNDVNVLLTLVEETKKLAYITKRMAETTTNEAVVRAATSKPRKI